MNSSTISHLFLKHTKGAAVKPKPFLILKKEYGIEGDANASISSLRQVLITRQEDLEELHIPVGGLKENIILHGLLQEIFQPGALVKIGETEIRLTFFCEPCYKIANIVPSMKAVIRKRGLLGVIVAGGKISVGDKVEVIPNTFNAFSDKPYERFLAFIKSVPAGSIVDYKMVIKAIGIASTAIRILPTYIKQASSMSEHPIHRIVDTAGLLIDKYIPDQAKMLEKEGIILMHHTNGTVGVDVKQYLLQEQARYILS